MGHYLLREDIFDRDRRGIQLGGEVADSFPVEFLERETWLSGKRLRDVPAMPLFTFDPKQGNMLFDVIDFPLPLVSKRLHAVLAAGGAGGLESYPFPIKARRRGKNLPDHYRIVNITRVVTSIAKAGTARLFVVRGGPPFITIDDNLKRAIAAAKPTGVLLQPFEDYEGD